MLSMSKIHAYYGQDQKWTQTVVYLECVKRCHDTIIHQYIFKGIVFAKMEENPLMTKDAMFGIPPVWTVLMNTVTENQDLEDNQQIQTSYSDLNELRDDF